uniref:Sulfatase N-terminal domain-containing protein n=1 Tax=Glossina brevipalpis TaxID=37001 RepID=A0A1A9WMW8_9MUSC
MSNITNLLLIIALVNVITYAQKPPNIVLFLTDDQDLYLHGMKPMRLVQRLIGAKGTTLTNAFTTSPLCCPSRASLLSGMYAHNHRTLNNSESGGCNAKHWRKHIEPEALPVLLQRQGYDTFFAGKYLNEYKGNEVPPGWKEFYGLHGNSRYYNYTLRENAFNKTYESVYLTDLLSKRALKFINKRVNSNKPFFLMVAPPAPHQPFIPAERHKGFFERVTALKTPNFNKIFKDKHWLLANFDKIPDVILNLMDIYFQKRWESLLAVDEMVAAIMELLDRQKQLENTYIIYTSDNGYHIGQFGQPFDKRQPYETDIRIPLMIRGPQISAGTTVNAVVALIDLAPTILEWANIPTQARMDGQSMQPFLINSDVYDAAMDKNYRRSLLIQHHGEGTMDSYNPLCPWERDDRLYECNWEAACHCQDAWNNTYACVRHFSYQLNRLYCEFSDKENFVEAYDIDSDLYQMNNNINEWLPIERGLYSLALANLTKCAGAASCADIILK